MKKAAVLVIIMIIGGLGGCSVFNRAYRLGNEAEINKNWDEAVQYYERAALENPKEAVYRLALLRAKSSASLFHLQQARSLRVRGNTKDAAVEYEKALSYDPLNRLIAEEMASLNAPPPAEEKPSETPMESPYRLKVNPEKVQMKFTEASLRSIFQALGKGVDFRHFQAD